MTNIFVILVTPCVIVSAIVSIGLLIDDIVALIGRNKE